MKETKGKTANFLDSIANRMATIRRTVTSLNKQNTMNVENLKTKKKKKKTVHRVSDKKHPHYTPHSNRHRN